MDIRGKTRVLALPALLAGGLAIPALGQASSGGASLGGDPVTTSTSSTNSSPVKSSSTPSGEAQPATGVVRASGNGITISTRTDALLHRRVRFSGSVPASFAGQLVEIQRSGKTTGWRWARTARGRVRRGGSFSVSWPASRSGELAVRAVLLGGGGRARDAGASPTVTVTVYTQSIATIFGEGFWGSTTACGQKLRRSTLGVAHRTLPCGTPVAILWHGRRIVVPVIDRGPYANHADWDLTEATARKIGMSDTETIAAVPVPYR